MGQPYNQPPMYQQPYNPFGYNQPPQQQQQKPQQGGGYDNFILNQLSGSGNNNQGNQGYFGW